MGQPEPLPEQRRFIERDANEHALLVAGPGTGKTFTVECRARHLVEQCGVDPDGIALLTLTKSLVESLAERVPYGNERVWLNGAAWRARGQQWSGAEPGTRRSRRAAMDTLP
jgi:hypothetical protein